MPYTVTHYPQGTFSWADTFSTDIAATKKFMTGLFGWTSEDMPTGEGKPDYTMFSLDGHYVAGGSPTFAPGMPSFWTSYITVDNVDAMVKKAESLGGKVTMPPMDVLDSGRMATIQDPTGASVALWQPKKHIGAGIVNTVGAMVWNELYTKDLAAAKKFYADLLGWTYEVDEKNGGYVMIKNNGRMNGGMMAITPDMVGMPPNWTVYFSVQNIEEAMAKVTSFGGKVHMGPKPISVGKIAMITDPAGAAFIIMEMSVSPSEWVE
jgi:predicted enzyme related to lactoylglutathione lyase